MSNIVIGSKVKLKGRPTRGVSFKVLSIDKWGCAEIKHSLSGIVYMSPVYDLELVK